MTNFDRGLIFLGLSIIALFPLLVSSRDGLKAEIPQALLPCYKHPLLKTKDLLLPMTMPVLINLIRKVENYQGLNMDMRSLSTTLLQRFRLDGIEFKPDVQPTEFIIPYSPSGTQFYKYKILMDKLIPSPTYRFPNESLNMIEQCTLHQMLSSSVNKWARGDESTSCNRLTDNMSYNSRLPRSADPQGISDVETFIPSAMRNNMGQPTNAAYQSPFGLTSMLQESMCPIENGVVSTRYGSVKAGVVVAGIAAGLQPQTVSIMNLIDKRTMSQMSPSYPGEGVGISNTWAATLSGEIAEVVILQGPTDLSNMKIGVTGGWNSTLVPKYYFLNDGKDGSVTETDIRGGVDGLILGNNVRALNDFTAGSLKLSQLLEMYYSEQGVFDVSFKGCKRKQRFSDAVPITKLQQESQSFAEVLTSELPQSVYVHQPALREFTRIAIDKLFSAVEAMRDTQCTRKEEVGPLSLPAVDLIIVIDCGWEFRLLSDVLSYVVEQVDVSAFGSKITIVNGKDGNVMVNTTQNIVDFYQNFNSSMYNMCYLRGFDMAKTLRELKLRIEIEMNQQRRSLVGRYQRYEDYRDNRNSYGNDYYNQRQTTYRSQEATGSELPKVLLFIPQSTVSSGDGDAYYIRSEIDYYRRSLPDVTLLFLSPSSKQRFSDYAQNANKDVFVLTTSDIAYSINPLVERITEVHKPIANPTCGSEWVGVSYNNKQTSGYLQSSGIHYYRVHPNYFYKSSNARIRTYEPDCVDDLPATLIEKEPIPYSKNVTEFTIGHWHNSVMSAKAYYLAANITFTLTAYSTETTEIQTQGVPLSVCYSRSNPWPNANRTRGSSDISCRQVTTEAYELRIPEDICSDVYAYQCQPYYISVAAPSSKMGSNNFACRENECRYPDMVKYTISHDGLSCYSCVIKAVASPLLIVISMILLKI